jgi:hypothetical protein
VGPGQDGEGRKQKRDRGEGRRAGQRKGWRGMEGIDRGKVGRDRAGKERDREHRQTKSQK